MCSGYTQSWVYSELEVLNNIQNNQKPYSRFFQKRGGVRLVRILVFKISFNYFYVVTYFFSLLYLRLFACSLYMSSGISPPGPPAPPGPAFMPADAMTSSILRIIIAASVAALIAWVLILRGSMTLFSNMSSILPV